MSDASDPIFPSVQLDTDPVFTPEMTSEDGKNRVARSGQQVGIAGYIVVVGEWVAMKVHLIDEPIPTAVTVAMAGILTGVAAYLMNRDRIRATKVPRETSDSS